MTTVDPTTAVLTSAGGDFFLTLFGLMFLFVLGLCSYLVYRMPKEWEASTDRIVGKLCDIMNEQEAMRKEQEALRKCYDNHDRQAKEILDKTNKLDTRTEDMSRCLKMM